MFSYSALVNYGKATLPSVEGWNMSSNIIKDPPKSIHTRKVDKVGETSYLNSMIDESADRTCDSINYYARSTNPMVSVNYGQGQKLTNNGSNAYLPYRVARDGAFRPPIRRQEDLLPLSRMPRIWTSMQSHPCNINYSQRAMNCGTAETTKEVKTQLLRASCEANKTLNTEPIIREPRISSAHIIYDPLVPGEVKASCNQSNNASYFYQTQTQKPILLAPSRNNASGYTNPFLIADKPNEYILHLEPNRPNATASTVPVSTTGGGSLSYPLFSRLPDRATRGSTVNIPYIPGVEMEHVLPKLLKVR
jgi:hypothetical protein